MKNTKKNEINDKQPAEQDMQSPEQKANPEITEAQLAELIAKNQEYLNDLQRTRADFENFRKQTELQKAQVASTTKLEVVLKFLPLIDDLDRAFDVYSEQLAPLMKNFDKTLATLSLQKIDSKVGVEFNPDFHDAISVDDGEGDREVIAETLRPGYLYENEVLRPAMVKVTHQK